MKLIGILFAVGALYWWYQQQAAVADAFQADRLKEKQPGGFAPRSDRANTVPKYLF